MKKSTDITNGQLASMWLWVQTGDRIAGLMRFADLIVGWWEHEAERAEGSIGVFFERNPQAAFFLEDQEELFSRVQTTRVMCASLVNALNALIENLVFGSCAFVGSTFVKKKPHWDDAVKYLRKERSIDVESLNGFTEYVLDANGNRIQETDAAGTAVQAVSNYTYNSYGFMTSATDPDGRETDYIPNQYGNLQYTVVKGVAGENLTPLATSSPFPSIDPNHQWIVSERIADVQDNTLQAIDPRGNSTGYQYDSWNRVTQTTPPTVEDTSHEGQMGPWPLITSTTKDYYDFNSNLVEEIDPNGNVTINTYDAMNRKVSSRRRMTSPTANDDANDLISRWSYDAVGDMASQTDPLLHVTRYVYDALLRPIETLMPLVTVDVNPSSTDTNPATTTQQYTKKMYYGPNSGSGAFTFGGFNPTRVIDANGIATDTIYDNAYRAIETIRRSDSGTGLASNAAARSTDLESDTRYNNDGKVIEVTVHNQDATGAEVDRSTYTFYDDRERPTITAADMNGDGVGADPATTYIDNVSAFTAQAEDLVTRTAYDGAGHPTASTDANGNTTQVVYDGDGRVVEKILPAVTVYLPDGGGLNSSYAPTTHTVYDAASNPVLTTDANGNQTKIYFDARNRAIMSILDLNGDGVFSPAQGAGAPDIVNITGYDLAGNKLFTIDPNGNTSDTRYDFNNRAILQEAPAVADASNANAVSRPTTTTQYDKEGNVVSVTDPRQVVTTTTYDEWNRPRFVTRNATAAVGSADRLVTETRYDANGNTNAVVLENFVAGVETPQVTTYGYDVFNRQTNVTLPDVGDGHVRQTTTIYDQAGDALVVTDPLGQKVQADYDRAGRKTETRFLASGGAITETRDTTYDHNGNPLTRSDLNGITTDTYDALNRLTTESRNTTTTGIADSYTIQDWYDANGNRTKVQFPDTGRILISHYDRASRLIQMNDQPAGSIPALITSFAYDPNGNRISEVLPNGVTQTSSFDALNRVTNLHSANAAGVIHDLTYGYNLASQRVSGVENLTGQAERDLTWTYDNLYRLTGESWTGPAGQTDNYTYDPAGNRLSQSVDSTASGGTVVTTAYTFDSLNELLNSTQVGGTTPGTTAYTYDLNGNRISKTDPNTTTIYIYDVSDRLIEADQGGSAIFTAAYDGATQRLSTTQNRTTTLFRYDGGQNFQEIQGGSVVTELVRAGGMGGGIGSVLYSDKSMNATPGPVEFFTYDAVGNTVALTDATGAPTQTTLYNAFGGTVVQTGTSTNDRLHNTKERDTSTGLDNYGMRYYDSSTGTFITRDPSGYSDGLNVYQSVHNNPLNNVDPMGLSGMQTAKDIAYTILTGAVGNLLPSPVRDPVENVVVGTAVNIVHNAVDPLRPFVEAAHDASAMQSHGVSQDDAVQIAFARHVVKK